MWKENSVYHLRKLPTAAAEWGEPHSRLRSEKLETGAQARAGLQGRPRKRGVERPSCDSPSLLVLFHSGTEDSINNLMLIKIQIQPRYYQARISKQEI